MRKLRADAPPVADSPDAILELSVVPAIDELVARFTGRGVVAGAEVIDMLLDLRLLAAADEVVGTLV